ncbi:SDR family NAD(P)-dependent oxidoreductase [Ornithinimicrobium cavernae]|uniref:SDR family NAD(P)-dependent oxidoreductase n=1 Tax=Ornithinimicrobium cavernae TaxID=2666047 RepID=UPI000D68C40A|nr:SDR family oxidoreductase [Ornithinimicrobium cavernae]
MTGAVVVLGAYGGVGTACVAALTARGVRVAAVGRSTEKLDQLAAGTASGGAGTLTTHQLTDPTDPGAVEETLTAIVQHHDALAGVITTLGRYAATPLDDLDPGVAREVLDTNLVAPMVLTAAAAPRLAGGGRIVHIGSVTSLVSRGGYAAYEAAKAGLVALSRSAAVELAGRGIAVNVVAPGWIRTPMAAPYLDSADPAAVARLIPAGRASEPEEIAGVAVWLALEAPLTLTGQTLVVDGGQSAHTDHLPEPTPLPGPTTPRRDS